jgi:hypothetical protein
MGLFLSGAGGDKANECEMDRDPDEFWSKGKILGFTEFTVSEKEMYGTYHYSTKKENWKTYKTTPILRKNNFLQ